jgi:hypothetical protein
MKMLFDSPTQAKHIACLRSLLKKPPKGGFLLHEELLTLARTYFEQHGQ